ncbi:MAG: TolC family protein [Elusimicrobia bacterium]|nr:TolC family protein [Elusimicrobiota bacterium]
MGLFSMLFVLIGALPAPAEATTVTWDGIVAEAAAANPDLSASRFSLEAARASYYQSFNGVMPQVTLSNTLSEANVAPVNRWSAQAAASMKILDAGQIAGIRAAAASTTLAEANLRKASADLRSSLRQTFSRLLFTQETLKVAVTIQQLRDRDSEMVSLRYDSGSESKGNMLRAKAQALQATLAVLQAQRDQHAAQRELAQRLGREDFEDFTASGTFGAADAPPLPNDMRSLLVLRPEVLIAEASARQAKVAVSLSESSLWPSLSANYARARGDSVEFPSQRYSWSAGATLSYPLFGGGPTSVWYGVMSSKRALSSAEQALASARVAGLSALESTWATYADAVDQVRVQTALLEAARQRNAEADIQYASGLLTYDNWEVIVSDRVSSESQAVSALRNAMDAETAWNRALGRALGE